MKILKVNELPWEKIDETQRRVFVRVDFNVPVKNGEVLDDYRIKQALPTIRYLLEQKCIVLLGSHFGRPKGSLEEMREKSSLLPVAERLAQLLEREVIFSEDTIGDGVRKLVFDARAGRSVILLENLRFDAREEANDREFAERLMQYADLYVNDAFGASHRAHASIDAITHYAKYKAAGFLLGKEWDALNQTLHFPLKPQMAILGGSKIADKILVIKSLMQRCSDIFVGGRMAQTFLAAQGYDLGGSSIEADALPLARRLMVDAKAMGVEFHFPVDGQAAAQIDASSAQVVDYAKERPLAKDLSIFDIGPKTIEAWKSKISSAKSIVWNGPMGVFENPTFAGGTLRLVDLLVELRDRIPTVAGGGETVAAIAQRSALEQLHHVSTGGGAMLEFLEGKALPGFEALKMKDREVEQVRL